MESTAYPPRARKVRIVCTSDTHNHSPGEGWTLPKGDVLIHAGDFTNQGSRAELEKAARWLEKADFAAKIVVAGNHDLSLDPDYRLKHAEGWTVASDQVERCRALMNGIRGVEYLEHSAAEISLPDGTSLRVFGSPFSPESLNQNWAFQYPKHEADSIWGSIPTEIDVLVTHTPPQGHVDSSRHWQDGGCPALEQALRRVRPALHVCGHHHEGRGAEIIRWSDERDRADGVMVWEDPGVGNKKLSLLDLTRTGVSSGTDAGTAVVNASIMAKSWGQGSKAFNKPVVVDIVFPRQARE